MQKKVPLKIWLNNKFDEIIHTLKKYHGIVIAYASYIIPRNTSYIFFQLRFNFISIVILWKCSNKMQIQSTGTKQKQYKRKNDFFW